MRYLQVHRYLLSWPVDISGRSVIEEELGGCLEMLRQLFLSTHETMLKETVSLYSLEKKEE